MPLTPNQRAARIEDTTFLADNGIGLTEAAHRLGITPSGLDKWLREHDPHLLARLARNDTRRAA